MTQTEIEPGLCISIHAPVKGATRKDASSCISSSNFNPRTREGCDLIGGNDPAYKVVISIHAPVKGATVFIFFNNGFLTFQSTHP